jgi:hypothetical protein
MVLNYNVLINGINIWVWFVLFDTRFLQSIKIIAGGGGGAAQQYLPQQFCTHFIYNSYSVFIININSGFQTVDCSRKETAIWTFLSYQI